MAPDLRGGAARQSHMPLYPNHFESASFKSVYCVHSPPAAGTPLHSLDGSWALAAVGFAVLVAVARFA